MPDIERWTAIVDDAVHEINMRWGVALDDSAEPDMDPLDQVMVRETAEAILRPHQRLISEGYGNSVTGTRVRLTPTQRDMLSDIAATGKPDGGRGCAIHTQRCIDSLVRRGLIRFDHPAARWVVQQEPDNEDSVAS